KSGTAGDHCLSLHSAIMSKDVEDRVAVSEIGADFLGAPDPQGTAGLAQHEQSHGVVDLSVDQHDALDRAVARSAPAVQGRVGLQLCEDVGGSIDERPVRAVRAAYGD